MTPRAFSWIIAAAIVALLLMAGFPSCKPPAPPAPPASKTKPLICVISGLGDPQLGDVAAFLRQAFPEAEVVEFVGRNAYLTDLGGYIAGAQKESPQRKVAIVCHSYGCDKAVAVANSPDTDTILLCLMFDPVPERLFGTFNMPARVKRTAVVWADQGLLIRANVKYPDIEYRIPGGHSEICHAPQAFEIAEREMMEALK